MHVYWSCFVLYLCEEEYFSLQEDSNVEYYDAITVFEMFLIYWCNRKRSLLNAYVQSHCALYWNYQHYRIFKSDLHNVSLHVVLKCWNDWHLYLNAQITNDKKHSLACSIEKAHVQDIKEFLHHVNDTEQVSRSLLLLKWSESLQMLLWSEAMQWLI